VIERKRNLLLPIAFAAVLLTPACGGEEDKGDPIPADRAAALQRQLDSIEGRVKFGGGACKDIREGPDNNLDAVNGILDGLPQNVDPEVRKALRDSFSQLFELTDSQCDEEKGQDTTPTETAPPAIPVPTQPTPTETVPTQTEEQKKPKSKPDKKEGGGGGDNGDGNGGGNGGNRGGNGGLGQGGGSGGVGPGGGDG